MHRRFVAFLPIFITVFIDFMGLAIVVPIFAPLILDPSHRILAVETSLNARGIILGFLIAIYPFMQFIGSPILGKLSDRHGRKKYLVISVGGTALAYLMSGIGVQFNSIVWMFIGRGLCGFLGGNSAIAQSAVTDIADEKSKAQYFGYLTLAMGVGFTLGPVIGGRLADSDLVSWFDFATPFWFSAILALVNTFMLVFFFDETLKKPLIDGAFSIWGGFKDIAKAFAIKGLRGIFAVWFFFVLGWFFFALFFQVYLIQKFDYDQTQIGDTYTYIGIWYAFFMAVLAGPVSHHFRHQPVVFTSLFLLIWVNLLLLVPNHPWWLYLIFPLLALFVSLAWPNILALVSDHAPPGKQGEILGIGQSIQSLAQAITPIASGPLVARHMSMPTIIAASSMAIAWVIFMFTTRWQPKSPTHNTE